MGFADSLARGGWHEKAVVDAEKTEGNDPQGSALTEQTVPDGRRARRHFSDAFKRALIEQSLQPGMSVARVALEHGINPNQLHIWRRALLGNRSQRAAGCEQRLVPVVLDEAVDDHHQVSQAPWADDPKACRIEIRLGSAVVWVHQADAQRLLPTLIEALK